MNFQHFNHIYEEAQYDEIQIIGKEIQKEGKAYHIMGMTLKDKKAQLYILEHHNCREEKEPWREKTPRESMKESMESDRNSNLFLHTREFRGKNNIYETAGGTSGVIAQGDVTEAEMLFIKMHDAGWRITGESMFYEVPWENLQLTNLELREEYETLPRWETTMEALVVPIPESAAIEKPVVLECGKQEEIEFLMKNGQKATCYINKVALMDVWAEEEQKFEDNVYREKMLQHMSEEEFQKMKEYFFEVLKEHCPKGKYYLIIEYECSEDISLNFYDKEYLDTIPKPREGSASSLFMRIKPNKEEGEHGYKLRGSVIKKPLEGDVKQLAAELFSYSEEIHKETVIL